jgi:hypothetical protein
MNSPNVRGSFFIAVTAAGNGKTFPPKVPFGESGNEFLLRKVPSPNGHSERSEESGLFEILRFAQDDKNDFPQRELINIMALRKI